MVAAGAHVLVPARRPDKASAALEGLAVEVGELDLSDQASVATYAASVTEAGHRIDLLIGNAGIMALPETRTRRAGRCSWPPTTSATTRS